MKIKNYAVINLNNMFPVPDGEYVYIDINKEPDVHYQALLRAEYRYIKSIQDKIWKQHTENINNCAGMRQERSYKAAPVFCTKNIMTMYNETIK